MQSFTKLLKHHLLPSILPPFVNVVKNTSSTSKIEWKKTCKNKGLIHHIQSLAYDILIKKIHIFILFVRIAQDNFVIQSLPKKCSHMCL